MKIQPFAVHDPAGRVILRAVGISRKTLRRAFADQMAIKWRSLWLQGFRVKGVSKQ